MQPRNIIFDKFLGIRKKPTFLRNPNENINRNEREEMKQTIGLILSRKTFIILTLLRLYTIC